MAMHELRNRAWKHLQCLGERHRFTVSVVGVACGLQPANQVQGRSGSERFGSIPNGSYVLLWGTMGDTFPNHNMNSYYRNPTFYYIGTWDPLGLRVPSRFPFKGRGCHLGLHVEKASGA